MLPRPQHNGWPSWNKPKMLWFSLSSLFPIRCYSRGGASAAAMSVAFSSTPLNVCITLTAHNWQNWKRVFLTCPCHETYRDEAAGLKSGKYTLKITIYVNMWNLGQFREILIFCQYLLNWSSNLKILLHMCYTYNCDYLKHSTFRFNLFIFQLDTDFPSQFCVFYRKIT